jgi:16S rRNA (uracil1498-N3)-methyltransferase
MGVLSDTAIGLESAAMHSLYLPDLPAHAVDLMVEGDEARHAIKVRRVAVGEWVRLLDGRGLVMVAEVTEIKGWLGLRVRERWRAEPNFPLVDVWSATPKGPRVSDLVDGLSQAGAASWTPMWTRLGVVDPRESKLERLERIVIEAAKQAGRPWLLEIREKRTFEQAMALGSQARNSNERLVIADVRGEPYRALGATTVRLVIGPEGGLTQDELDLAIRAGGLIASFGPHAMRIETAAVVATGVILATERAAAPPAAAAPGS